MGRNYKLKAEHEGLPKFSFSKLSTFSHCPYGYYLTYVNHIRGRDNIYGNAGTSAHEQAQDMVMGKIDNKMAVHNFKNDLDDAKNVLGLKFPTEKSAIGYEECIIDFLERYNPEYEKYDIEKGFDTLIGRNKTLVYGFIDLIIHNKDKSVDVVDYKTSSDFSKQDFKKKKMQLLVYAKALMEEGIDINRLYFNMLKYCKISWVENKKDKSMKSERNKVGDKLKNVAKRMLKKEGLDEFDIEMRVNYMINNNCIDELIQERFTISDYEVDVELNEESLKEMEDWVDGIIDNINKFGSDITNYKNVEINKGSEFYCKMLCGKDCTYLNDYLEKDSNSYFNRKKKEKDEEDSLDDLL